MANNRGRLDADWLKIRGKTLIVEDTIFQISNITSIRVVEFPLMIPIIWIITLFFGVLLVILAPVVGSVVSGALGFILFVIGPSMIAIALLAILWILYRWLTYRYGLQIITAAGAIDRITLIDANFRFLRNVALTLKNVMDSETPRYIDVDFNNYTFVDKSTNINAGDVHGGVVAGGNISGTIAQNV